MFKSVFLLPLLLLTTHSFAVNVKDSCKRTIKINTEEEFINILSAPINKNIKLKGDIELTKDYKVESTCNFRIEKNAKISSNYSLEVNARKVTFGKYSFVSIKELSVVSSEKAAIRKGAKVSGESLSLVTTLEESTIAIRRKSELNFQIIHLSSAGKLRLGKSSVINTLEADFNYGTEKSTGKNAVVNSKFNFGNYFNLSNVEATIDCTSLPQYTLYCLDNITFSERPILSKVWSVDGQEYSSEELEVTLSSGGDKAIYRKFYDDLGREYTLKTNFFLETIEPELVITESCEVTNLSISCSAVADSNFGEITEIKWIVEGNETVGILLDYTFSEGGKKAINITATTSKGYVKEKNITIEVVNSNTAPVANFIVEPLRPRAGEYITLNGSYSIDKEQNIIKYEWFVNEEKISENVEAKFLPPTSEEFNLKLIVTDSGGLKSIVDKKIIVKEQVKETVSIEELNIVENEKQSFYSNFSKVLDEENKVILNARKEEFVEKKFSIFKGRVVKVDGAPISGVRVSVQNKPGIGYTYTNEKGEYSLALNSLTLYTLNFEHPVFLPAQRQVKTLAGLFNSSEDISLVKRSRKVDLVEFGLGAIDVQSERIADQDGERSVNVLFPEGVVAKIITENGEEVNLDKGNLRITEYTVGENGPRQMPAELPANSDYTYAFEIGFDEEYLQNGVTTEFSVPLPIYVDNFLNNPTGSIIPVGYYDRKAGVWKNEKNGITVKIISIEDGIANLSLVSSDAIATTQELDAYGISIDERKFLAKKYFSGKSLWRATVSHFSTFDFNYPRRVILDKLKDPVGELNRTTDNPKGISISKNKKTACTVKSDGSIIDVANQTLTERIPLPYSDLFLNYSSNRTVDYLSRFNIPLTGDGYHSDLNGVELTIDDNGKKIKRNFRKSDLSINKSISYIKNSLSSNKIKVNVGYKYESQYGVCVRNSSNRDNTSTSNPLFNNIITEDVCRRAGGKVVALPARNNSALDEKEFLINKPSLEISDFLGGLNNFSLNIHHKLVDGTVFKGNGESLDEVGYVGTENPSGFQYLDHEGRPLQLHMIGSTYLLNREDGTNIESYPFKINNKNFNTEELITNQTGGFLVRGYFNEGGYFGGAIFYLNDGVTEKIGSLNGESDICLDQLTEIVEGTHLFKSTELQGCKIQAFTSLNDGRVIVALRPSHYDYNSSIYLLEISNSNDISLLYSFDTEGKLSGPLADEIGPWSYDFNQVTLLSSSLNNDFYIYGNGTFSDVFLHYNSLTNDYENFFEGDFTGDGREKGPFEVLGKNKFSNIRDYKYLFINTIPKIDAASYIYFFNKDNVFRMSPSGEIECLSCSDSTKKRYHDGINLRNQSIYNLLSMSVTKDGDIIIGVREGYKKYRRRFTQGKINTVKEEFELVNRAKPQSPNEIFKSLSDGRFKYIFNINGDHLQTIDLYTNTVVYNFYYENNNLTEVHFRDSTKLFVERSLGLVTALRFSNGERVKIKQDEASRLNLISFSNGDNFEMTYKDGSQLLSSFKDRNGKLSLFDFSEEARLLKDYDLEGWSKTLIEKAEGVKRTVNLVTTEGVNELISVNTWNGVYDVNLVNDLGVETKLSSGEGKFSLSESSNGSKNAIYYGYDEITGMKYVNSLTSVTPAGLSREITKSISHTPDSIKVENRINGTLSTSEWNKADHSYITTDALGRKTVKIYDGNGNVSSKVDYDLLKTVFTYTNNKLEKIDQGGRVTNLEYDSKGYLSKIVNPNDVVRFFENDIFGNVLREYDQNGNAIVYTYDGEGNLSSIQNMKQITHGFNLTTAGIVDSYNPPALPVGSTATTYDYDKDRRLKSINLPSGESIVTNYVTGTNKVDSVISPEGATNYSYNNVGQLDGLTNGDGESLTFTYDGDLLTDVNTSGSFISTLSIGYNSDFNIKNLSVAGQSVSYTHFTDGAIKTAGPLSYTYNDLNPLMKDKTLGVVKEDYTYNSYGEIESKTILVNGNEIKNFVYGHDNSGRVNEITESGSKTIYTYDDFGQLKTVQKPNGITTYNFDLNGNRDSKVDMAQSTSGTYDMQDRVLTYGDYKFEYDLNGMTTKIENSKDSKVIELDYDVFSNLRSAKIGSDVYEYVIDPLGRRVGKKKNGTLVKGFIYIDQLNPIAELDQNGNFSKLFIYGSKQHVPDAMKIGAVYYKIVTDHLGSVRMVINSSTGEIMQEMSYDEFGNVLNDSNPGFQPFGFAGGIYDRDLGLVRFGARDYNPVTGRWMSKDPIGFGGGDTNLYRYANNDPVNFVDPSGLAVGDWWDFPANYSRAEEIGREVLKAYPGRNNMGDARRHSEWNRRMVEETNYFTAWTVGVGYEIKGLLRGAPIQETFMDLHNNAVGREAGREGVSVKFSDLIILPNNGSKYDPYGMVCK